MEIGNGDDWNLEIAHPTLHSVAGFTVTLTGKQIKTDVPPPMTLLVSFLG
jgi:hypothetical protein